MSSLASVFNSSSTLITFDIYKKLRDTEYFDQLKNRSETELVMVGRISTLILIVLSVMWIPVIPMVSSQLYIYINSVASYTQPPFAALFLVISIKLKISWEFSGRGHPHLQE